MKTFNFIKRSFSLTLFIILCFTFKESKAVPDFTQTQLMNNIVSLHASGNEIWACSQGGLLYSNSNGTGAWTNIGFPNNFANDVVKSGSRLIVALTSGGVQYSDNNGTTWNTTNMTQNSLRCIAASGNTVLVGTYSGIYRSIDNGMTWGVLPVAGTSGLNVTSIVINGSNTFATAGGNGVYYSPDHGATWTARSSGIVFGFFCRALTFSSNGSKIYVGTLENGGLNLPGRIYSSINMGVTWSDATLSPTPNGGVYSMAQSNITSNIAVAYSSHGILVNSAGSWTFENSSLGNYDVRCLATSGTNRLFAGTTDGLYYSDNLGDNSSLNWVPVDFAYHPVGHPYTYNLNWYTVVDHAGFILSNNAGTTWTSYNSGLTTSRMINLITHSGGILVSTRNGIYSSTNTGATWQSTGMQDSSVVNFAASGTNIYAVSRNTGFYRSTNAGLTWAASNSGITNLRLRDVIIHSGQLFVCGKGGIYKSSNQGSSWSLSSAADSNALSFATDNSQLYCVGQRLHFSSDAGGNWGSNSLSCSSCFMETGAVTNILAAKNGKVYLASSSQDSGLYISSNNGATWSNSSRGWASRRFTSVSINADTIYLGDRYGGISYEAINDIVKIEPISNSMPQSHSLSQNYPNPFNPVTNINFEIPVASLTRISIYDMLGKEVAVLVNSYLRAGKYNVTWNAASFPSGVYFFRLETEHFNGLKKMILIK